MFNPQIKFKMSTITCNEEMKGNAKCKNSRCRLPISDNWVFLTSSHGCGIIEQNLLKSAFSDGVGHF